MRCDYSIIILTYSRLDLLKSCITSVEKAAENSSKIIEILICINGPDLSTKNYLQGTNYYHLDLNSPLRVGAARNLLIKKAKGDYLIFIDDDVVLPKDYLINGDNILINSNSDVLGGPDQPFQIENDFQRVLSLVMKTYLAMGPTKYRHTRIKKIINASEENLILCNLWVRKALFNKFSFPLHYVRNEENIFLHFIKKEGYKLEYNNNLFVFHHRKKDFKKLIESTFYSGMYRMISAIEFPESLKIVFFLPLVIIILFPVFLFFKPYLAIFFFLVYLIIVCYSSLKIAFNPKSFFQAIIIFFIYNFIYPAGQIYGFFRGKKL